MCSFLELGWALMVLRRWLVGFVSLVLVVGVCVVVPISAGAEDAGGPGLVTGVEYGYENKTGLWYDFGYYADGDGDGIVNGLDPDFGSRDYGTSNMFETAGLPVDAVLTGIWDSGAGVEIVGQAYFRVVEYDVTSSGENIIQVFGEPQDGSWSTLNKAVADSDQNISVFEFEDGDSEELLGEPDFSLSSEQVEELEGVVGERTLTVDRSPYLDWVLEDMAADGIDVSDTSDFYMDGNNQFAYVEYETFRGTWEAYYRHKPLPKMVDAEIFYSAVSPVYRGVVKQDGPGWENFVVAKNQVQKQRDTSHYREAAQEGAKYGALAAMAAFWLANVVPGGVVVVAMSAALGAVFGAVVNIAIHGTKSMYHLSKADSAMSQVDDVVGSTKILLDPGIVGLGYSAYWLPVGAESVTPPEYLAAGESVFGVDVMVYNYIRPNLASQVFYSVAVNVDFDDEDYGLVLHALKTRRESGNTVEVTAYNSAGETLQESVSVAASSVTQEIDPADLFFSQDTDRLQTEIDELLPANATVVEQTTIGDLTNVLFKQPGITGTRVLMLQKEVDRYGEFYIHQFAWLSSPAAQFFVAGVDLLNRVYATLMYQVGGGVGLTRAALRAWGMILQNIDMSNVATEMGYEPQTLTTSQYATTVLTTQLLGALPQIIDGAAYSFVGWLSFQLSQAAANTGQAFNQDTALAITDTTVTYPTNLRPDTGVQRRTPDVLAQGETPATIAAFKALTDNPTNLRDIAGALNTEHASETPVTRAVRQELLNYFNQNYQDAGFYIADNDLLAVDILGSNPALVNAIQKYVDKLYVLNNGDPNYKLVPNTLEIRRQERNNISTMDFHKDARSAYTITIPVDEAHLETTKWVQKNYMRYFSKVDEDHRYEFNQADAEWAGVDLEEILVSANPGSMVTIAGTSMEPILTAAIHSTPDQARTGRKLALFKFTMVRKTSPSGCCIVS